MAVKPSTKWPAQTKAADANYPYGSAQDVTVPGDGTGTPWVADLINDFWGMGQKFLNVAGIVPSGNPDTILASDYYDAISAVAWARANHTGTQALGTITGHDKAAHDALNIDAATLEGNAAAAFAPAGYTPTSPAFHVHRNAASQTIPDNVLTVVTWPTEEFDTNGDFAANVFTPTVLGKFLLSATLDLSGLTAGTTATLYIYKNGALYKSFKTLASAGGTATLSITAVAAADGAADYFDIRVKGTAVAVDWTLSGAVDGTYFSGSTVSPD